MRRELLMAAHPKMSPPQARFWKHAARIMAIRGALGFVMAADCLHATVLVVVMVTMV